MKTGSLIVAFVWQSYSLKYVLKYTCTHMYTPTHNATYAYVCANTHTLLCKYLHQFWIRRGFSSMKETPILHPKNLTVLHSDSGLRFPSMRWCHGFYRLPGIGKIWGFFGTKQKIFQEMHRKAEAQSQNTLLSTQLLFIYVKSDINLAILSDILLLSALAKTDIFVSQYSSHPNAYSEHHLIQMFPAKSRCHTCGIGLHITFTLI